MIDIVSYNKKAWDLEVERKNTWTCPVESKVIEEARKGHWSIVLTPLKPVPREWFGDIKGKDILCLASGGGQQGPILAAAGAKVTVFDNSPNQLKQDRLVADQNNLELKTVEGDMADLSCFENESFDLIFHPVSNCFVPNLEPVWKECYRVLRKNGKLLVGFINPVAYIFDAEKRNQGILELKHKLPYSDLTSLTDEERSRYTSYNAPLEFGHTMSQQIGGQIDAGFVIDRMFEDRWREDRNEALDRFMDSFIATRATKLN